MSSCHIWCLDHMSWRTRPSLCAAPTRDLWLQLINTCMFLMSEMCLTSISTCQPSVRIPAAVLPLIMWASVRKWWRDYFTDHPSIKLHLPEGFTGTGASAKDKVYCTKCLGSHSTQVEEEDRIAVEQGQRQSVRSVEIIETHRTCYCTTISSRLLTKAMSFSLDTEISTSQ